MGRLLLTVWVGFMSAVPVGHGAEFTVEELAELTQDSVVTLSHKDRQGKHNGMGTGFVVHPDGLIATSLHVIGEARPIEVRFRSGKTYPAQAIHAWDRKLDLAVIQIEASGLRPLVLGDSDALTNGQSVVAVGNPMGLEWSIVAGVVSGIRQFEHSNMIQLAIPIEPGNSGGPLLDRTGRVHGLLNLKSTVTQNLGFATPISKLKPLLEKPNSVSMERWLRIGALDDEIWETIMGARWSQLTGRIRVQGSGDGFGGRALCLHRSQPEFPYEISVQVKLNDESGAAGLVFGSDRGDRHYGFYPSNGQLRLTRFDGENVFSWNILHQIPTPHYQSGEWNHLTVRHTAERIEAYVNGHRILVSADRGLPLGRVGLAKFRDTEAEFKGFEVRSAVSIENPIQPKTPLPGPLDNLGDPIQLSSTEIIEALREHPNSGEAWLLQRARALESEAARLRQTGANLHRVAIAHRLVDEFARPEAEIDLLRAALLIAKHDKPEVPLEDYLRQADRMAEEIRNSLPDGASTATRIDRLTDYLFQENGFHGSYFDYNNNANSYLDNVIDDREGIPISLSVLFLELGRRVGIEGLSGFPLPYHFLVKHEDDAGDYQLIDPFNTGERLTYAEASERVTRRQSAPFRADLLQPATKKEIINRMLRNLLAFTQEAETLEASLPYLDLLIALNPDMANLYLERAWIHLRTGNTEGARSDLQWVIDAKPPGINIPRVQQALESL